MSFAFASDLKAQLQAEWGKSAVHQYLQGLSPRDRMIVYALAVVIALLVVYAAVWKPIADWRERADLRYQEAVSVLAWIDVNDARLRGAGRSSADGDRPGGSLYSLVASSAVESGVQLTRIQPEGGGGVSVFVQEQEFNQILRWLDQISSRHQVTIRQLSVEGQASSGLISARINLI